MTKPRYTAPTIRSSPVPRFTPARTPAAPRQASRATTWGSTEPIRKIVNKAFADASLPAFGPHAFHHMLARHAAQNASSVAELVATSQNLRHTDVLTTLRSYGQISHQDQRKLITGKDWEK